MMMTEDRYEVESSQQIEAQRRLTEAQSEVDEVVGIMRMNVDKVVGNNDMDPEQDVEGHNQPQSLKGIPWSRIRPILLILLIFLLIIAGFFLQRWLVQQKCSRRILGYSWCSNTTAITSTPKTPTNTNNNPQPLQPEIVVKIPSSPHAGRRGQNVLDPGGVISFQRHSH